MLELPQMYRKKENNDFEIDGYQNMNIIEEETERILNIYYVLKEREEWKLNRRRKNNKRMEIKLVENNRLLYNRSKIDGG